MYKVMMTLRSVVVTNVDAELTCGGDGGTDLTNMNPMEDNG